MQIYIDRHGIQRFERGQRSFDHGSQEPIDEIIWDAAAHAGEPDPEKIGGYLNNKLDWSQEAFDQNEALKATIAAAEIAAEKTALLAELQAKPTQQTAEGYSERARILFAMDAANASRAAISALRGAILSASSLEDLQQRVLEMLPTAPAQLTEQHVAASLAAKQAQAIG